MYGDAVVTATRKVALSSGWSLHGNQDGAPFGWLATSTPSVSSSQPMSPQRPEMGTGLPAYRMSILKVSPAPIGRSGLIRSLSGRCGEPRRPAVDPDVLDPEPAEVEAEPGQRLRRPRR